MLTETLMTSVDVDVLTVVFVVVPAMEVVRMVEVTMLVFVGEGMDRQLQMAEMSGLDLPLTQLGVARALVVEDEVLRSVVALRTRSTIVVEALAVAVDIVVGSGSVVVDVVPVTVMVVLVVYTSSSVMTEVGA